jgi:hypothetical protein
MIAAALIFGACCATTPRQAGAGDQGAAVVTIALNLLALWKQEPRDRERAARMETETHADFIDAWRLCARADGGGLLVVIALGTLGFGMADVLLEPYGGQVLDLTVSHDDETDGGLCAWRADRVRHRLRVLGCGRDADRRGAVGHDHRASRPLPPSSPRGHLGSAALFVAGHAGSPASAPACSATAR